MSSSSDEAAQLSDLYEYPHEADLTRNSRDHRGATLFADLASSKLDLIFISSQERNRRQQDKEDRCVSFRWKEEGKGRKKDPSLFFSLLLTLSWWHEEE